MGLVRIRYKGLSDVRAITKKDLEQFGVKVDQDLVWDNVGAAVGGQVVPGITRPERPNAARGIVVEGMSDDFLAVLRKEGTFTVTAIDDEGADGEDIIKGEPLDDTGERVVDSSSGQVSEKGEPNADADPVPSGTESGGSGAATGRGRTGRGSSTAGGGTA